MLKFHKGTDEKFMQTVLQYQQTLVKDGYVFRYRRQMVSISDAGSQTLGRPWLCYHDSDNVSPCP